MGLSGSGSSRSDAPGEPGSRRLRVGRPSRLVVLAVTVVLSLAIIGLGWAGVAMAQPGVAWVVSPGTNTATIRLTPGAGLFSHWILVHSQLAVTEEADGHPVHRSSDGVVRLPVPPGSRTRLSVQVTGPRPLRQTVTVTTPPPLRVTGSLLRSGELIVLLSSSLRRARPGLLCGRRSVSFPAPAEVAVARGPQACVARLSLAAEDGERAVVLVTVPAVPAVAPERTALLYAFASAAHRAIYITVDDGWTPSQRVLSIMERTRLPVTAFLIKQAAQQHLPYWRDFVKAGGTVGDHTVSHPDLTTLSLDEATAQWRGALLAFRQWFGVAPVLGRPPYGAFDATVEMAAARAGLKVLVGWSATVDSHGIHTWNGEPLQPGEIVLLHWVPGLAGQLTELLRAIRAQRLSPMPLTTASFAGLHPQQRSLAGD